MRTVVMDIRQGASAEEFVVTVLVNDHQKTFRLHVVLPHRLTLQAENSRDFENTFEHSMAPKRIAGLVLRSYRGEIIHLPIDLGDI